MLCFFDFGEVVASFVLVFSEAVEFGGDAPDADAADEEEFEGFGAFDQGLECFGSECCSFEEDLPKVVAEVAFRVPPGCDDAFCFLRELLSVAGVVRVLVDGARACSEELLEGLES